MQNQERFDRIKKALALRAFPNELYLLYTDTFQYGLYAVSNSSIKVFRRVIETQEIDAVQELPKEEVLSFSLEDLVKLMDGTAALMLSQPRSNLDEVAIGGSTNVFQEDI